MASILFVNHSRLLEYVDIIIFAILLKIRE